MKDIDMMVCFNPLKIRYRKAQSKMDTTLSAGINKSPRKIKNQNIILTNNREDIVFP